MLLRRYKKYYLFFLLIFLFFNIRNNFFAATYGSDTAVSIQTPVGISGPDNIIKTFAFCNSGFSFLDASTSCSWESIFPVTGQIDLSGGNLYLLNDLTLNNIGSFKDFGKIFGREHRVNLSENFKFFGSTSEASTRRVLSLIARQTPNREIRSLDWSYDGLYVAVAIDGGAGDELLIYSFDGSSLTGPVVGYNIGNNPFYDVKWHPSNYNVIATSGSTSDKINLFQFTPPATLTRLSVQNPAGTFYSVAWDATGSRMAAGGTTLTTYRTSAGTLDVQITPTNTAALNGNILSNSMRWAPLGSKQDLIAVTNNAGTNGSMHLYNFTGTSLDHLKNYTLGLAANCLDWAETSTYVAVGFTNNTVKTYQHLAASNVINYKNSNTGPSAVNTVSWTGDGNYLAAGYALSASGNEFHLYFFDASTYALSEEYPLDLTTAVNVVRFTGGDSTYMLRGDATTRYLSVYRLSTSPFELVDVKLFLNSDLNLYSPLTFRGDCSIQGGGHRITFTGDGGLNLAQDSSLEIQLTNLNFNEAASFSLQGQDSEIIFKDSIIELDHDITWGDGKFKVYGDLTITGQHSFSYDTAFTSTIQQHSSLNLENGCEFIIGKSDNVITQREPLDFEDSSSVLNIEDSTLHIKDWGWTVKRGVINVSGESTFDVDYTDDSLSSTTQALVFGDGVNAGNDPFLKLIGSSTKLTLLNGSLVFDTAVTTSCIQFLGRPVVDVQTTDTIYYKRPINLVGGELITTTNLLFYVDPSSYLTSDQTRYLTSDNTLDYHFTGTIVAGGNFLLDENDILHLNAGYFNMLMTVNRGNNSIRGSGGFSGLLLFTDYNSTLSWAVVSSVNTLANIDLNGGRMIFTANSGLTSGLSFVNTGTIDLQSTTFELGTEYLEWSGNHYWMGDGATIRFNNDVELDGIWTFSGDVVIDGNSFVLDLAETGSIVLERGASLTLKNISLFNLSRQTPITCLDNDCSITLNFADLLLSGDYQFDTGSIYVYYDSFVDSLGDLDTKYTFTYSSTKTSTIDAVAYFKINSGAKFYVGRVDSTITDVNQQPFIFTDGTAKLILEGGTLHITSSGMILTKGVMDVADSSVIEIENSKSDYGLILGDGTAENDFEINIGPGADLTINSGQLVYNNFSNNRIVFDSYTSSISVDIVNGLFVQNDLTLADGTYYIPDPATITVEVASGVNFNLENLNIIDKTGIQDFILTGTVVQLPNLILDSHDRITINPGILSRNIYIENDNNLIVGSGELNGTIYFTDANSSLTWNLQNNIKRDLYLNGGRIRLANDTAIEDGYSFKNTGTIDLTTYKFNLGPSYTEWSGNLYWIGDGATIRFNNDVELDGIWTFSGDVIIDGNSFVLDLAETGSIVLERGASLTLKNISLFNLSRQTPITCLDNDCQLTFNFADLLLSGDYQFDTGSIYVYYDSFVDSLGDLDTRYTFTYSSTKTSTIDAVAYFKINSGATFSVGRVDSTITDVNQQPFIFTDGTAKLILEGGTLHITSSGMILAKGVLEVADSSVIEIENSKSDYGLILGDGTAENDFEIKIGPGADLSINSGQLVYNNFSNNRIVFDSYTSSISVRSENGILVQQDLRLVNGAYYIPEPEFITLKVVPGANYSVRNFNVIDETGVQDFILTGTVFELPNLILDSHDRITINPGILSRNIYIENDNNLLVGSGELDGIIYFTDQNSSLTWNLQNNIKRDLYLNGGRIRFANDSAFEDSYSFKNTGTVDLNTYRLDLGSAATEWSGDLYWMGDGATIRLNNDVTIDGIWTFSGDVIVDGRNYVLDLAPTGSIVLERGASLTLKDVSIASLSRQNPITCLDDNCSITLNVADFLLTGDYLFDTGSLYVYYNSTIQGLGDLDTIYTFSYASTQTSTVDYYCWFKIGNKARFSVGRVDSTITDINQQPFVFTDGTATLLLDGGTLHITSSGMILTKGVMDVSNSSAIEIENSKSDYGLILGDGTVENDFEVYINPGANLSINSGQLVYNNYSPDRLVFGSQSSTISINVNYGVLAQRNLNYNSGILNLPNPTFSGTKVDPGIVLKLSNFQITEDTNIQDFFMTGTVVQLPNLVLDSNDRIIINPGTMSRNVYVENDNNLIAGSGELDGDVYLTDANSSLTWNLRNNIKRDLYLNGGRIRLANDTAIEDSYSFKNTGTIDLNTYRLDLGSAATEWSGDLYWMGEGAILRFNNDVTIDRTWTFSGNVVLDGGEQTLILEDNGRIILERGANLTIRNILIYNLSDDNPIICGDDNCTITFDYTDIALGGDYLFDKGSIFIYNDTILDATGGLDERFTFTYASTRTSTIDEVCKLQINNLVKFSIGRQDSSITNPERQPLVFLGESAPIFLNGGTLHITSSGMILANGKIEVDRSSNIEVESNQYDYGLVLGDGTAENDFEIYISPGCELNIRSGRVFYNNYNEERIVFDSKESALKIEGSEGLTAYRDMTLKNGSLILPTDDNLATQNDSLLIQDFITHYHSSPYSVVKLKVHDMNPYRLLDGDFFYVLEGFVTADIIADSGSSSFGGVAGYAGNLSLKNHTVSLRATLETSFFSDVTLNGGTISFYTDSQFAADKIITGSGVVQFVGTKLNFGPKDTNMTSTIYWQGLTSGGINLNSKTSLSGTWTFGGAIQINGNGNILDLSNGGILNIRPNSTLVLDNVSVKGLGDGFGSINFMDDTSTLRLSNAYIELDNNFTTTIGGIYLDGPTVLGVKNYNWTIDQNASMTIDGVTLWQDPLDTINYGSVQFGSGSVDNYLTLLSSGTIKTESNLDVLNTDTTFLQDQIINNSNAIVWHDEQIRWNSNAIDWHDDQIKYNSDAIKNLEPQIENNSNAILNLEDQVEQNSNAIMWQDEQIRWNSNAIDWHDDQIKYNSDAIKNLEPQIESNSNAILNLEDQVEQNSNAIMWHDNQIKYNSNAIKRLEDQVRWNSDAILNLDASALAEWIRWNSNAIINLDATALAEDIRHNSSALVYGLNNNSNAIINLEAQVKENSDAIIWHDEQIRWNSNAIVSADFTILSELVRTNSNAILNLENQVENNSNAIIWHDDQIKWNSDAIVDHGNNFISLNDGKFYAVGSVSGDIVLTDRGVLSGDINLNGATLSIRNDLQLSSQTQILTSGNLDLYGNALLLEGDITLPENVDLKLTTSGIIDGCGNSFAFGHNSKIRLDEFITLTLRNIKLKGLRDSSDGNASISILNPWRSQLVLQNSEIYLSDNFSFTSGELFLHGDVKVCGTSQLNYTSTHAARIASSSSLLFDQGTTFSYGPSVTGNRNLIIMEDVTSILYFNGATLKSTTTGLNLTTGTLIFDGKNYIYNEDDKNGVAVSASQAIIFDNDLNVKIMPAANLEIMSGRLIV